MQIDVVTRACSKRTPSRASSIEARRPGNRGCRRRQAHPSGHRRGRPGRCSGDGRRAPGSARPRNRVPSPATVARPVTLCGSA
ncbi:MAG: hypothetical protein MZV63_16720 [Marinilabiliales bacterium]|nr:hypothetical protein [Marinilabiliales bacterium]